MFNCWRGCRYWCCAPAGCAAAPRDPLAEAKTRYAIKTLDDALKAWRMVYHSPTNRLQEKWRDALEEARTLFEEAPNAKSAAKALTMIGDAAKFCDGDVLVAVKNAQRAARDVVVMCCGGPAVNRDAFLEAAGEAFAGGPLARELKCFLLLAYRKLQQKPY